MQELTNEFIRTLAAANGITIPDERLDLVRREYEGFLRRLAEINTLPLPRETEPAIVPPGADARPSGRRRE
jgi:hypothetical protein